MLAWLFWSIECCRVSGLPLSRKPCLRIAAPEGALLYNTPGRAEHSRLGIRLNQPSFWEAFHAECRDFPLRPTSEGAS